MIKIEDLLNNSHFHDVKKFKGKNLYHVRQGKYIIVYKVEDKRLLILIVGIAHRKEIYKNLNFFEQFCSFLLKIHPKKSIKKFKLCPMHRSISFSSCKE